MKQKGFTLIELMIVIAIIAIIAAIAIPNLIEARKGANESAAIATLRTLVTVQTLYRDGDKNNDGTADYAADLTALSNATLIDSVLAAGTKQGYIFTCEGTEFEWSATATPASTNTGNRRFFVNESGVIRFTSADSAGTGNSPIGG